MEGETLNTPILFCLSHNCFVNYYNLKHFETSILKMIATCKCLGFTSLIFFTILKVCFKTLSWPTPLVMTL
jgi:hypothetical protein